MNSNFFLFQRSSFNLNFFRKTHNLILTVKNSTDILLISFQQNVIISFYDTLSSSLTYKTLFLFYDILENEFFFPILQQHKFSLKDCHSIKFLCLMKVIFSMKNVKRKNGENNSIKLENSIFD